MARAPATCSPSPPASSLSVSPPPACVRCGPPASVRTAGARPAGRMLAARVTAPGPPLAGPVATPAPGCQNQPVLHIGVVALGVTDVERAAGFWCEALGYERREDGFGGWAVVLTPPAGGPGTKIALQRSETPLQQHPRLHLDLHVADAAEQAAEAERLVSLGAVRVDWDSYPDD